MILHIVLLSGLYAALTLLLLYLLIGGRLPWPARAGLVLLFSGAYFGSWLLWQDLAGWPARAVLPDRFLFHAASITEPDVEKAEPGSIYLWLTELRDEEGPIAKPRAYRVPYLKSLHSEVQEAQMRLRNGMPQVGRRKPDADGQIPMAGTLRREEDDQQFELGNLPSPALPEK